VRNRRQAGSETRQAPHAPGKRFELPAFGDFAQMVERAGLAIGGAFRTSRSLDPDPQRVYLLEHKGRSQKHGRTTCPR
jgi:hypothetical protein